MPFKEYIDNLHNLGKTLIDINKSAFSIFTADIKNDVIKKKIISRSVDISDEYSNDPLNTNLQTYNKKILSCAKCIFSEKRKNVVLGKGSNSPLIMFIGKAPKIEEDDKSSPFQGEIGEVLKNILNKVLFTPEETAYFTNILKCRISVESQSQIKKSISVCSEYLFNEIAILKPKIICALGNEAISALLSGSGRGESFTLNDIRGKIFYYNSIPVMPTYNPSAFISHPDPNKSKRKMVFADMLELKKIIDTL